MVLLSPPLKIPPLFLLRQASRSSLPWHRCYGCHERAPVIYPCHVPGPMSLVLLWWGRWNTKLQSALSMQAPSFSKDLVLIKATLLCRKMEATLVHINMHLRWLNHSGNNITHMRWGLPSSAGSELCSSEQNVIYLTSKELVVCIEQMCSDRLHRQFTHHLKTSPIVRLKPKKF